MPKDPTNRASSAPDSTPLTPEDIGELRTLLESKRDELTGQVQRFRNAAVDGSDSTNWEEDGTDAFDREFAFKMAGSRNEMLNQIDEALRKMDDGTYGVCEVCEGPIGRERIKVLPFCASCIKCQSETERGRMRSRVRTP